MRTLTYFVAASLDGYIAGPNGEVDWLFTDQDYGLDAFMAGIDAVLIGTATYTFMTAQGFRAYPGVENYVLSRTLVPEDHPEVEVVATDPAPLVRELKAKESGGLWLVGGGVLFRYLLNAGLVDEVRVAVHPVLLGSGIPMVPANQGHTSLQLIEVTPYETGLVVLRYLVPPPTPPKPEPYDDSEEYL